VTRLEHHSYSPDLAAADFYLFPRMKSTLKKRRFCDANDIIKNATKELKRLTKSIAGMFRTNLPRLAEVYSYTRGMY
jgi:hypothetical protein